MKQKQVSMDQKKVIKARLALAGKYYKDIVSELKKRGYDRTVVSISRYFSNKQYNPKIMDQIEEILKEWGV